MMKYDYMEMNVIFVAIRIVVIVRCHAPALVGDIIPP